MIPRDWKIERQADVLKTIHITAPNGYVASVNAIDRNPANVLYMLADALLRGTDAEIYKSIADNYAAGVPAVEPVADEGERYCLACEKLGHRTDECHSTHGLNTPAARELFRLVRLAHGVAASAEGYVEAGLVCQACAGDAPGGKCQTPKCVGGPIVRELVPAAGVAVDDSDQSKGGA